MRKAINFTLLVLLTATICLILDCSAEKRQLQENIIRLHVVANSDSTFDQEQKLRVRDAVNDYLQVILVDATTEDEAESVIRDNLSEIADIAQRKLIDEGSEYPVCVKFGEECFDIRRYDTFSLPSGVYTSLRIEIGDAEGRNWWCVAFPSLCMSATSNEFTDVAVSSGFSDRLTNTLAGNDQIEIRFYFLDLLGNLENFLHNR